MAYWVEDEDGDLLNLDKAHHVFIEDWGPDYTERFRVLVTIYSQEFLIRKFCSKENAKQLRQEIYIGLMGNNGNT
jgi:hypothetical protein